MPTDPAVTLLSRIASGDREAFAALYRRFGSALLGILVRMLGDRREAEDLLHEVFLEIWRRASSYDPSRGTPFRWLTLVTRSRADRTRSAP